MKDFKLGLEHGTAIGEVESSLEVERRTRDIAEQNRATENQHPTNKQRKDRWKVFRKQLSVGLQFQS
jgi:hypothetical protein